MNFENKNFQTEQLQKLIAEYQEVIAFISDLNKTLIKRTIVPIQENLAYFMGDIKKTNQCRVYLGEDYFIETTNHRAIKILESRLKRLEKLIVEAPRIENAVVPKEILNIAAEDGTLEIKEDLSDLDYKKLKEKPIGSKNDIDTVLRDKLKSIKQRREQHDNDNQEMVLIRKDRKGGSAKSKDVIALDTKIHDDTKPAEQSTKKSLFLEDEDV
jgi:prefoldin alpha subunit